jgi:hypothetical protein
LHRVAAFGGNFACADSNDGLAALVQLSSFSAVPALAVLVRASPHCLPLAGGVILFVLGTAGLGGYVQYGPFALAGRFLLLFLVIAALFLSGRAALWNAVLMLAGLLLIALGAIKDVLQFQGNAFTDTNGAISWALTIFATFAYGGLVAMLVWRLIHILSDYRDQLMLANAELERRSQALA